MTNAALLIHRDAYDTTGERLLGRHSAGESFLRGFLRHADVDEFRFWHAGDGVSVEQLDELVRRIEPPSRPVRWFLTHQRNLLGEAGVLNLPGPMLGAEAWARRPYGATSYSVCGLTHTTATARTMDSIADLLRAPTEGHDALVCTSSAVRASVEAQLDGVRAYLDEEFGGPRRRAEPQRVTIPLGVNVEDFRTSPEDRKAWRERLEIPQDAVVALYVGRFNAGEKMNPALMALALERAAKETGAPLYWVNSGWSEAEADDDRFHAWTRALCPSVRYRHLDGRPAEVRFSIWSVADVFISFSDNIQETFGLAPVEAMAAGLPCVVTDWDGYRDTVRHGEDGFRVPTAAPAPGDGFDLAYRHAQGWTSFTEYAGASAQFTAIDYAAATEALSALIRDADLRRRLGRQAQVRARQLFDWSAIVPQYQALWGEQNARRLAAPPQPPRRDNPFRPDPFSLFAAYPTHHLADDWRVTVPAGLAWADAKALLGSPLAGYGAVNRPTLEEVEQILDSLVGRSGARAGDLAQAFPAARRPAIARGLLWVARFGVIELRPPA
jgi:glycosyltransferase involved in cell wall biosynthesis